MFACVYVCGPKAQEALTAGIGKWLVGGGGGFWLFFDDEEEEGDFFAEQIPVPGGKSVIWFDTFLFVVE
jgi:hypothetical protein